MIILLPFSFTQRLVMPILSTVCLGPRKIIFQLLLFFVLRGMFLKGIDYIYLLPQNECVTPDVDIKNRQQTCLPKISWVAAWHVSSRRTDGVAAGCVAMDNSMASM